MPLFDKQGIIAALNRLGELAQEQGIQVRMVLLGGAAMVLAYEAR